MVISPVVAADGIRLSIYMSSSSRAKKHSITEPLYGFEWAKKDE